MTRFRQWWPAALWAVTTLFLSRFHEPWRDEAQAWLVARSAQGWADLLLRASVEASGPVYYLMLWPLASVFPQAFPEAIFWLSWVGTYLLVVRLSEWDIRPLTLCGILGGFLLFYEYSALARLYGWGGFFLLSGIREDKKECPWAASTWLGLAALTQLTFWIAVAVWRYSRWRDGMEWKKHLPVLAVLLLALVHLQWGSDLRPWQPPGVEGWRWVSLGTTLGTLILPVGRPLGVVGYAVFALGMAALPRKRQGPFLMGAGMYAVLFSAAYAGVAQPRHGGALYWLWLGWSLWGPHSRWVRVLLAVSVLGAGVAWVREIRFPYSHGMAAARFIRGDSPAPAVSVHRDMDGFVVAARLNVTLHHSPRPLGCPFFPPRCGTPAPRDAEPGCDGPSWYHVARDPDAPPPETPEGEWERVWGPGGRVLTDERFQVFRLNCPISPSSP